VTALASTRGTEVVITGIGLQSPLGDDPDLFWKRCVAAESGVTRLEFPLEELPCRIAGQVHDFDPHEFMDRRDARRATRFQQFAVAVARDAITNGDVDLDAYDPYRIGVVVGTGSGGLAQAPLEACATRRWAQLDPTTLLRALPDMAATRIAATLGIHGPITTLAASCASGTEAIGIARDLLRLDRADLVIAIGTEAWLTPLGIASFASLRALSTRVCEPEAASCPFDIRRDGFVPAEGAAAFVLERCDDARSRRASVRAEVSGFAVTNDGFHQVAPDPAGASAAKCMTMAIEDAGIGSEDVGYINAHGTSTVVNDTVETAAIRMAFGRHAVRIPISSTKSLIGHSLGASGAIELVACVKSLETGWIHPTLNLERRDPQCDLDYVPGSARRAGTLRYVLKNTFAFGSQNACVVLGASPSDAVAEPACTDLPKDEHRKGGRK
jgi:3-oxoacyl-[acyl-carrier-protein] synthase II